MTKEIGFEQGAGTDDPEVPNRGKGLLYGAIAAAGCILLWGGLAYLLNRIFLGAILVGYLIAWASMKGYGGYIDLREKIAILTLTAVSIVGGEVIYFSLDVLVDQRAPVTLANLAEMIPVVAKGLWRLEKLGLGGFVAMAGALLSAHYTAFFIRMQLMLQSMKRKPGIRANGAAAENRPL